MKPLTDKQQVLLERIAEATANGRTFNANRAPGAALRRAQLNSYRGLALRGLVEDNDHGDARISPEGRAYLAARKSTA